MTNVLLEGPGRTLECVYPKFMVDLVQGDETKRSGGFLQQQQRLRARLTQEVLSQTATACVGDGGSVQRTSGDAP